MVGDCLLFIMGKSTKAAENINQNYSEEWSSPTMGFFQQPKSALPVVGGLKAPLWKH